MPSFTVAHLTLSDQARHRGPLQPATVGSLVICEGTRPSAAWEVVLGIRAGAA